MPPDQIVAIATGTAGLTAFLIFLVFRDRADHQKEMADERARNDKQLADERVRQAAEIADVRAQRDAALVDNRAQAAGNEHLADVIEKLVAGNARLASAFERMTKARPK